MTYLKATYRHYKGNLYEIIGEAIHSETLEEMVIYQDLSDLSKVWVRPKEMFFENVIFEGQEILRFMPID